MADPAVRALRGRIRLIGDDALSRAMPVGQGIVEITLADGRLLRHHTTAVRGTPANPMSRKEVHDKCLGLIAPVTGTARAEELCATVWKLETVTDVRQLRPLFAA